MKIYRYDMETHELLQEYASHTDIVLEDVDKSRVRSRISKLKDAGTPFTSVGYVWSFAPLTPEEVAKHAKYNHTKFKRRCTREINVIDYRMGRKGFEPRVVVVRDQFSLSDFTASVHCVSDLAVVLGCKLAEAYRFLEAKDTGLNRRWVIEYDNPF